MRGGHSNRLVLKLFEGRSPMIDCWRDGREAAALEKGCGKCVVAERYTRAPFLIQ
jgi:hypothetical protein